MQMSLSDGRIKTFEVSIEQFHQLRYNVAKVVAISSQACCHVYATTAYFRHSYQVLRDMQELERHPSETQFERFACFEFDFCLFVHIQSCGSQMKLQKRLMRIDI